MTLRFLLGGGNALAKVASCATTTDAYEAIAPGAMLDLDARLGGRARRRSLRRLDFRPRLLQERRVLLENIDRRTTPALMCITTARQRGPRSAMDAPRGYEASAGSSSVNQIRPNSFGPEMVWPFSSSENSIEPPPSSTT